MNLPSLPYRQLGASLLLAVPMLLAARAGDPPRGIGGTLVLVATRIAPPVSVHAATSPRRPS
jgi:hypothetical protein